MIAHLRTASYLITKVLARRCTYNVTLIYQIMLARPGPRGRDTGNKYTGAAAR